MNSRDVCIIKETFKAIASAMDWTVPFPEVELCLAVAARLENKPQSTIAWLDEELAYKLDQEVDA